jgi:uncharacterized glyoxalase superfamily protein PhnB
MIANLDNDSGLLHPEVRMSALRPPPPRWPRASTSVFYDDAPAAIDWLSAAFGFELRLRVEGEGGRIEHSELEFGDAVEMVGSAGAGEGGVVWRSARAAGGCTQAVFIYVDDIDAHHAVAVAAGAQIFRPLHTSDYGEGYWSDRSYGCTDPEGHAWWFAQRLATHA